MALGRGAGLAPVPLGPWGCFLGREGGDSLWRAEGITPTWKFCFRGGIPSAAERRGCGGKASPKATSMDS